MSKKDNNIKILSGCNPREKSEERMINMKRKFLEDLGLEDKDTIDKIMDENSSDIGKAKGELETVQQNLKNANTEIETLKGQVSERDGQLETFFISAACASSFALLSACNVSICFFNSSTSPVDFFKVSS